jgi:hypothetical protein
MAITLKVPTTQTFCFKLEEDHTACGRLARVDASEPHDGFLTFRQATAGDAEQRTAALSRRLYRPDGDKMMVVDETNLDYIARLEVRLTLKETDFSFPDGEALEFEKNRVKSAAMFDRWWDILPPSWAREVHRACLEANPDWSSKSQPGEDDE